MTPLATSYLDLLKKQFNNEVGFVEKRPGLLQLVAPLYHEDGDMVDIFLKKPLPDQSATIRVTDCGLTLMRLSYTFDLNSDNKQRIFERILAENGVQEEEGVLFIDARPESLYPTVMQLAHTVGKVSNMALYKREIAKGAFYELLDEFVESSLGRFNPHKSFFPMKERTDLEVDYCFSAGEKPLYLMGVNNNAKARIAAIAFLEFRNKKIPFRGVIVHQDLSALSKADSIRVTSASDKQFPSLDDFKSHAEEYLSREAA